MGEEKPTGAATDDSEGGLELSSKSAAHGKQWSFHISIKADGGEGASQIKNNDAAAK